MNILLVTDSYPPEIRAISSMMQDLAEELTLKGHKVNVVTSWPQYNLSEQATARSFQTFCIEKGIGVMRVKTLPHHKVNYFIRGIAQLSLPYLFFWKARPFFNEKIDAVIVYSPPLSLAQLGERIKKTFKARYLLSIQDIFPQNAIDLGILKNRILIKFFERMEKRAYQEADQITTHTENSRRFLIEKKQVRPEKISTVTNWLDLDFLKDIKPTGKFRRQYKLENKFIFLFGGILGPSQNLDFVIHVARRVQDLSSLCFLLIGDGTEKKRLQKMVQEYNLGNVRFEPFVSQEDYPYLVKEVDVGLVCLSYKNKTAVVPGKILTFMASAIPVVAFLNKESDGHALINEAKCGYSLISDEEEKAAELVRKIYREKDKLKEFGLNGFQYAARHFSKKVCIDKLAQLIQADGVSDKTYMKR